MKDFFKLESGPVIETATTQGRITKDLSGLNWKMEKMRVGQGKAEGIHLLKSELSGNNYSWNQAKIPGDVYTDLYLAGEIDDPYYGRNMAKTKWVQEYEWWYNYAFNVEPNMHGKQITLVFEGVDYSCEVWLNKEYLGRHEGMYSSFEFDITDYLDYSQPPVGVNLLTVKLDPPPKNQQNFAGLKHNFAGDYLTGVIPFGIWRPVKLIATNKAKIDNYRIEYNIGENTAQAELEVNVTAYENTEAELVIRLSDGEQTLATSKQIKCRLGEMTHTMQFEIPEAKLWWPYDLGEPFLYDLEILVMQDGEILDNVKEKTGVRQVTLTHNPGFTEEESKLPWTFNINGKPMFLRSACWTQPSFFYGRNSVEKYELFLNKAKEANINNLRFFGWHPLETKEFYDICDRLGLTVWTNFAFATQEFRSDKEYIDKVKVETKGSVIQRRNHPSMVMWMGGEEVYFTEAHVHSNNRKLMEMLGDITKSLTDVPYADASPLSSREGIRMGYATKESRHANSHYYAAGALFMEDFYPELDAAIIPELTAASSPNVESLKKFIPQDELWPLGKSFGYHMADIHVLQNLNYEVHGDTGMASLEQFVEYTQIAQGTVAQFALESFRRRKPHVSGVALCHFNTNWPIIKWDIVDYYGVEKLSYAFVKRSYQPLLPSMDFSKRRWDNNETFTGDLYVINDWYKTFGDVKYTCVILDNDKNEFMRTELVVNVEENSSTNFETVKFDVPADWTGFFYIQLMLEQDGELLCENEYRLLVANQEIAKQEAKALYDKMHVNRRQFGKGYYRYFPEMLDNL